MSDADPIQDEALVGTTSQDVVDEALNEEAERKNKDWELFNLWNCMLMVSIFFILLAIVKLMLILRSYSPDWPFGGSPWSTGI